MLIWCDLETTGLNAAADRILEIALILTDDSLREVARFHRVTNEAGAANLRQVDRKVLEMHASNGLWNESLLASGECHHRGVHRKSAMGVLDCELVEWMSNHACIIPQLAGSTVSFDRNFLEKWLPDFAAKLHYRNLDVSSLNEMAKRFWPSVYERRPRNPDGVAHRAMPDIEESLAVARYYARTISNWGGNFGADTVWPAEAA